MAKNTEIELKLLLSREGLEKMLQLDFMQQAMRPDSFKKRRLVSTYYVACVFHCLCRDVFTGKGTGSFTEEHDPVCGSRDILICL